MDNLSYKKLEIQSYMQSPIFDTERVEMLVALRTRTVRRVKNDFRGMFQDVACPLGCCNSDTLPNILTCPVLQDQLKSETVATQQIVFRNIFSPDTAKQKQVTELYIQLMEIRSKLITSQPVALTGPCIDLQELLILSI